MTIDKFTEKAQAIRLWRNESARIFSDRLINQEDRDLV